MKYDYGIIMTRPTGESYKQYFTDDQHWDICNDWTFCVIAVTEDGHEVCIDYTPPRLDRDDDESESDYLDRCVEATDWTSPDFIDDLNATCSPYHWDRGREPGVTFTWFCEV